MDRERVVEIGRRYGTQILLGVAGLVWIVAFGFGWSNSEWKGFWSSAPPTRGSNVWIGNKAIKTKEELEKDKAKALQMEELMDSLRGLRKDVLGDRRKTRGDSVHGPQQEVPEELKRYTQRDACFQMKLENPERWADVDCMSDKFDDTEPWFKAPRAPAE